MNFIDPDQEKAGFMKKKSDVFYFLLKKNDLFRELSRQSIEAIKGICEVLEIKTNTYLFTEGDKGESVFLLISGNIELYKTTADGNKVVVRVIDPGEIFAEVILFENDCYPVNARAINPSQVYVISKLKFFSLLEKEEFRTDFIRILMKKQRYLTEQLVERTRDSVEVRFIKFLEKQYGKRKVYHLTFKQKDIAAAIDTKPETLSRLLFKLKQEKNIRLDGKTIEFLSQAKI